MTDQIDQAIAATRVPTMIEVPVQIASTGRPCILLVPDDLVDGEIVELAAFVLIGMRESIARTRATPASKLFVPRRQ